MTIIIIKYLLAAFSLGIMIMYIFMWTSMYIKSRRCKYHMPIKNGSEKYILLILPPVYIFLFDLFSDGLLLGSLSSSQFSDKIDLLPKFIIYISVTAICLIGLIFLPKAYITEKGILSIYSFYPKGMAEYSIENGKESTFVHIYTGKTVSDVCYIVKSIDETAPLLDELYDKFNGTPPNGRKKSYAIRNFLTGIVISMLIVGIFSAWYVIKKPIVIVGDKFVRTDSEYALFNSGMLWAIYDGYDYFPDITKNFNELFDAVDRTNGLTSNDLGGLKDMPNLKHLSVGENSITDLTEIGELTELEGLYFGGADYYRKPDDYTPLKNLTKLKFFSGLGLYNLNDLTVFENTNDLLYFELTGADIQKGLSAVCNKDDLTVLNLYSCTADDFSPIGNCKKLKYLCLSNTNVNDLSFLKNLNGLEKLYITGINAGDYSVLLEMPSLTYISAYEDTIPDDICEKLEEKGVEINLTKRKTGESI